MKKIKIPEMSRKVRLLIAVGGAAVIGGGTATGLMLTGGSHPSEGACKTVMTSQYRQSLASGRTGTEPAACEGLPSQTMARLAAEIASAVPPGNFAACWQYSETRSYVSSAGTMTAAKVSKIIDGMSSAELIADGKLHDDLDVINTDITGNAGVSDLMTATAQVDADCTSLGVKISS